LTGVAGQGPCWAKKGRGDRCSAILTRPPGMAKTTSPPRRSVVGPPRWPGAWTFQTKTRARRIVDSEMGGMANRQNSQLSRGDYPPLPKPSGGPFHWRDDDLRAGGPGMSTGGGSGKDKSNRLHNLSFQGTVGEKSQRISSIGSLTGPQALPLCAQMASNRAGYHPRPYNGRPYVSGLGAGPCWAPETGPLPPGKLALAEPFLDSILRVPPVCPRVRPTVLGASFGRRAPAMAEGDQSPGSAADTNWGSGIGPASGKDEEGRKKKAAGGGK